ncbi:phage tail tape measure protein [Pseudomonas proteolytica]|uniref:phage tail tape measure protein n=1 Tax=Pseudomonas proteolytica TaxID=219574 RepID=UPI00089897E1|nr:phage tail tape measure protein [Pseudomonas proteolytica]KAA8705184.1 phage tail tape measure protein [Pseudomonas proteolytica]TWR85881.1 phage tail tape measure protein [Pseudomonas proteolytica]SED30154.1 phage tail tape measure protein, TP901 family, core region [Pseudomonas proteolytica]
MANDLKLQVLLSAIDKATRPLKQINNGSLETARALKAARDRLKELNTQQKDVTVWRSQRAAVEQTNEALNAAQAKVKTLSQQFAATGVPTRAMAKDFRTAVREAQRLKQQHQQQSEQLQGLRSRLYDAGISTKNLGTHERQLREQISATNASISAQGKRMAELTAQHKRAATARSAYDKGQQFAGSAAVAGGASLGVAYAASRPVIGVVKEYVDFESAMMGVAKQVDGARDDNGKLTSTYYEFADAIKAASNEMPIATTEFAALVEAQARAGIQGKENLLTMAKVSATAAVAFDLPAEQVGEDMGRIAGLYKVPIKNIAELGDALNYLDDSTRSKGGDIIETLTRMSDVADKLDYRKAAALGSTFLSLGAAPEVAASASRAMVRELAIANMQSKTFREGMKMVNMDLNEVQGGMTTDAMGTMMAVLERIKTIDPKQRTEVATRIFGKEYGKDAAKLVNNLDELRRQLKLVDDTAANGSMQKEMDIRADAIEGRWQVLQNKLFNTKSSAGETMRATMVDVMDALGGVLDKVNGWVKANPALTASLLKVVASVAVLSALFGGLALTLAGILGPFLMLRFGLAMFGIKLPSIIGIFKVFGTVLRTLGGILIGPLVTALRTVGIALWGLSANPIVLVIAAVVAALAAGAYLIYTNWDAVKNYFANAWTEIKAGFSGGIGGIINTLANFSPIGLIYQAFAGVLSYLGVDLPSRFTEFGNMIVNGLVNGLMAGLGSVKTAISSIGDASIGWFKEKLGIHSPSRVFAELGGFTMAGLTKGLEGGQKGPLDALSSMGKQLTAAGTLALSATAMPALAVDNRPPISSSPAAAVYDSHDTYEFTITAAPGMDLQGMEKTLRAMLNKIENEKKARQRSKLSDRE